MISPVISIINRTIPYHRVDTSLIFYLFIYLETHWRHYKYGLELHSKFNTSRLLDVKRQ
jgi:hypothetical protein